MEYRLYQIDEDKDKDNLEYSSLFRISRDFGEVKIDRDIYKCVYEGKGDYEDLEDIYGALSNRETAEELDDFSGRAMSVSDVVEVTKGNEYIREGCYYCDNIGFKEIPFDLSKDTDKDLIEVVYIEPGCEAKTMKVGTDLESLQNAVNGYIEAYYPFDDSAVIVCNDEGKLNGMKPNRGIFSDKGEMLDIICGPFFICDGSGSEFKSLSNEQIKMYMDMFKTPEKLVQKENGFQMVKLEKTPEKGIDR